MRAKANHAALGYVLDDVAMALRKRGFPDQRNDIHAILHADDAVAVEFDLLGTHLGPFLGAAPTGRAFRCRMLALFLFAEGGDGIVCERVYFDAGTIVRQLGLVSP
jgi:predicted ester cyclase